MIQKIKSLPTYAYVVVLYVVTRLTNLTKLPVFADEAIYIRWAQVGLNEPDKYLFLSMLDGKPPLHNWLIKPFLFIFPDPLFASRFLSVLAGVITLYFLYKITYYFHKSISLSWLSVFLGTILPFWITNHRLGLAESLISLFFTAGLYYGIKSFNSKSLKFILLFGLSFGLALWTKTNAVFFIPVYALIPWLLSVNKDKKVINFYLSKNTKRLITGGFIGTLIFLTLRFSPIFPQLFSRSQDYTFMISEIISGEWRFVLFNTIPRVGRWLAWYMVPTSLVIMFYEKKLNKPLLLMTLAYSLPLIIIGRVLSSRYFFPAATLLTLMIINGIKNAQRHSLDKKITNISLTITVMLSIGYSYLYIFNPDQTPFVKEDRIQYLEEWSSGHGIPEIRDFINDRIKDHKVTVATEGYFGTLPDGLLMYFDRSENIHNLELYGIGQPIQDIPKSLIEKTYEREVYLVANSHRLDVGNEPNIQKVGEFKRPNEAPSLILLKINTPQP